MIAVETETAMPKVILEAVEVAAVDGINYSGHFFNTVAIERESNGQATTPSIVYFILCVSFPRFFISL